MAVREIEKDIEQALKQGIEAQLLTDGVSGVTVETLLGGAPGEEPQYPYVFVMCRPMNHKGAMTDQWTGDLTIAIKTKHLESYDREATNMGNIMGSVSYAIDYLNFSSYLVRVNSLALRRTGGSYTFEDSTNEVEIDVEIVKACGSK